MEKVTLNQLRKQIMERNGKQTLSELAKEIHETVGKHKLLVLVDFLLIEANIAGDPDNIYHFRKSTKQVQ